MTEEAGSGLVKSAERTVRIMEALATARRPLTLAQLQERTAYPRSSLYALVRTLVALRWVESRGDAYGIGPQALLTGTAYLDRDPALPWASARIEAIRDELGVTVHYARLDMPHVVYLATREPADSRRTASRVGRQLPAHATALGKALLAERTDAEVAALLPSDLVALTEATVTTRAALAVELDETRERGWSVERGQNLPDVVCVGAAVAYRIPASDAMSCSIPLARADEAFVGHTGRVLARHAAELAGELRRAGVR